MLQLIDENVLYNFCVWNFGIVEYGQYYRLITGMFLHANPLHLGLNMYALYVIGQQLEGFIGKTKYIAVYFISGLIGSLLSVALHGGNYFGVGASGAIFGLLGATLYFGYHYRVYLGGVLQSQIIPLIVTNLAIGFMFPSIDNLAHIGGLIGGFLGTMALGIKHKSSNSEKINGIIITIAIIVFLCYLMMNKTF